MKEIAAVGDPSRTWVSSILSLGVVRKAWKLSAKQKYEAAANLICNRFGRQEGGIPSEMVPIAVNILYADLCHRLDRRNEAYHACEVAIAQINKRDVKYIRKYNDDEINYLRYHCKWILSSLSKFADSQSFQLTVSIGVISSDFDTLLVKQNLRKLFPMTVEDGFALDKFIYENTIR